MQPFSGLIDLHLHLDGAISPASARQLAALQGIALPATEAELVKLLRVSPDCRDLNEFLEKFAFPCSLLQTAGGITLAVKNLLDECSAQGLLYAEVRFAPQKCTDGGLTQRQAVEAAIQGVEQSSLPCGLILCCMRGDDNEQQNIETIRLAGQFLGRGVVAADLAGAEALFATRHFAPVFALARQLQVPFTIHAGEADGPQSVWDALEFGAARIGHGVRSTEDPALLQALAQRHTTLELCPTSNLCTAIYPNLSAYPLRTLMQAGIPVTINTDDPVVEGTTLADEWKKVIETFALTPEEVRQLVLNSVEAAFATPQRKQALRQAIARQLA